MSPDTGYDFGTEEVYEDVIETLRPSAEEGYEALLGEEVSPMEDPVNYIRNLLETTDTMARERQAAVPEAHDTVQEHYEELRAYEPADEAEAEALADQQKDVRTLLYTLKAEKKACDALSAASDATQELSDRASSVRDRFGL